MTLYSTWFSVKSPGIAFFIKEQSKESALLGSLVSSWPILVMTFLLAYLSGIIMWFLVSKSVKFVFEITVAAVGTVSLFKAGSGCRIVFSD